jgi:hypothetical protein
LSSIPALRSVSALRETSDRPLCSADAYGRSRRVGLAALVVCALALAFVLPRGAAAQPFGGWTSFTGSPTVGYIRVPHSSALNPTGAFTFEAWVNIRDHGSSCVSLAGKGFTSSWWIGACGSTLRSYLKGSSSLRDGGSIPVGRWTHIAVTYDGANRRHYINGELISTFPETGPLPTNTNEVRFGGDVDFQITPPASINELRLWNVARTTAQLRAAINVPITSAQPGLVAVWPIGVTDVLGPHDGTIAGSGVSGLTFPVALSCGTSGATALCLQGRFQVTARFRSGAPGTAEGTAQVVNAPNPNSGLFWFFSPDNWEVMVKAINGCGLNNRVWIFSAATTNVFYRLDVFDVRAGKNKVYFNYPGPPAPAVTDTDAFASCPL